MNNKMFWGMTASALALVAIAGGSFVGVKKIQNLQNENNTLRIENTTLSSENETLKIDLAKYQKELIAKQIQLDTLTQEKNALESDAIMLKEQIEAKDSQIETLNNQLTSTKQDLDTQTAYLETCQTKASEIKSQIETLSQEDAQANALELSTLQTDLENIEAEVTKVENKINTLNATVSSLNSNITTLTTEKQELQTSVTNLNSQISAKDTEIENLNIGIARLNSKVTELQEKVDNLSNSGVSVDSKYYHTSLCDIYELNRDEYKGLYFYTLRDFLNSDSTRCYPMAQLTITYEGHSAHTNISLDDYELVSSYKLNGVEKSKEEMLEYLNSYYSENNVASSRAADHLQAKLNLNAEYKTLIIDIVDFPLSGKYVNDNGSYFDFDKLKVSMFANVSHFLLEYDAGGLMLRNYLEENGSTYTYHLEIVSDTQLKIDNVIYTKVTDSSETEDVTLPAKFVGNYISTDDFETVRIGTSTMGYSSSPDFNLIKFENNVASFDGFGDIPFTENSDGTISLVYDGKTYTKQS